ncbi:hypothetical protein CWO91_04625 [Bradyrhizobium genosp. SA-3]|nr:hypothetical protein CWO91_04625 [Bradyrhizobium genosp. SA-3]
MPPVATSKQRCKDSQVPERFELCKFESLSRGVLQWLFARKRPAAIGVKALFPGFIGPAPATSSDKVPSMHYATRSEGMALE